MLVVYKPVAPDAEDEGTNSGKLTVELSKKKGKPQIQPVQLLA